VATTHPSLPVKVGSLTNKQVIETVKLGDYYQQVQQSCHHGTFRYADFH
jgi:hypothetical protein